MQTESVKEKPVRAKKTAKKVTKKKVLPSDEISFEEAKLNEKVASSRYKAAKASREERLDLIESKKLIDVSKYRQTIRQASEACKAQMYRITQLSPQLATETDPNEISVILRDAIDSALNDFYRQSTDGVGE